eukprot:CAMPEP_0185830584 /NCGR_PEP_ID=MMETSP1353-20130828/954_1 /TAXON_ID=1077150 /ORGANISM="Erythrolobus australicus, Strain CCMP3124" /LENGTH=114 /DNA_ID=CAMNT_0028528527 /DNA_START=5 /DNA_END=349 /DNA_ORIENTATION=+
MGGSEIARGVEFDTIAREWRMKWSEDDDKASLVAVQEALNACLPKIKALDGVIEVNRVVCGACHDFKVITSMPAEKFSLWGAAEFAPEKEFLSQVKDVPGIYKVETQTFTFMKM